MQKPPKISYRDIWEDIPLAKWRDILAELGSGSWEMKGNSLKGHCPFPGHVDSRPSCIMTPSKGCVKCFSCGQYEVNPLKFLSTVGNISWSQAAITLSNNGAKSLPKTLRKTLQESELRNNIKNAFAHATHNILVAASQDTSGKSQEYLYARQCLNYLESRGIPKEVIPSLPIGVVAPQVVMNKYAGKLAKEVYLFAEPVMRPENIGGLVFFYHKSPTEFSRFKIRTDFMNPNSQDKREMFISDDSESLMGFFGLANYHSLLGTSNDARTAILVEGEFDALAHLANYSKGITYDVVLGIGGAASTSANILQDTCNIRKVFILPDHPDHGGNNIAKAVLSRTNLTCSVFEWPDEVKAKDPAEAIEKYGWQAWLECITKNSLVGNVTLRNHFTSAYRWLTDITYEAVKKIPQDDLSEIKRVIASNGACLRDYSYQRMYCVEVSKFVTLDLGTILELVVGQDDSEEGFVLRIIQALKEEFYFIGIDSSKRSESIIKAWNKRKREPRDLRISHASELFGRLAIDLGNAVDWIKNSVGIPRSLAFKMVGKSLKPLALTELNTKMRKYIEIAMENLCKEIPVVASLEELKSGAHYVELKKVDAIEGVWVVVNGNNVYLGKYREDELEWSLLEGPRVGDYILNINKPTWSSEINSCEDLNLGKSVDVEETFDFIVSAINLGWQMEGGIEDCQYLAAAIMLNTISGILPRQLYTILNGERGSGKSKLLDLIAGENPRIRLLECVNGVMTSYTPASARKTANRSSLGLALDEFEDKGQDRHSRAVRDILRDVRALTSSAQSTVSRGNVENPEATNYVLKCQIWACAINRLREEADISRFMQLESIRVEDKPDPHTVLKDVFGYATIQHFRRNLTIGMFSRAKKVRKYIDELRGYYNSATVKDALAAHAGVAAVPSRFLDSVVLTAAIIKLVGLDPHNYIKRVVKKKIKLISNITTSTQSESLFESLLSSRVEYTPPGSPNRYTSVRSLLGDPAERYKLQELECGLSYATYQKNGNSVHVLVVLWSEVLASLFKPGDRFKQDTPKRLQGVAGTYKNSMRYRDVSRSLPTLKKLLKPGISSNDITIFDVTAVIENWEMASSL